MTASPQSHTSDHWQLIQTLLPPDWESQADLLGFSSVATPPPPGAVRPSAAAKLRIMLHLVANDISLRTTAAVACAAGLVTVSHVAIHKWFAKAVNFFSYLLLSLTAAHQLFAPKRWAGYEVRAIDATTVQRPGAQGATARIHYCQRLNDMSCVQWRVTTVKVGETLRNFTTGPGTLDIADRGYSNPASIAAAVDQGGDVLIRWSPHSLPLYDRRGRLLNPARLLHGLKGGEVKDWSAYVRIKNHTPIKTRVVITRLPDVAGHENPQQSVPLCWQV